MATVILNRRSGYINDVSVGTEGMSSITLQSDIIWAKGGIVEDDGIDHSKEMVLEISTARNIIGNSAKNQHCGRTEPP